MRPYLQDGEWSGAVAAAVVNVSAETKTVENNNSESSVNAENNDDTTVVPADKIETLDNFRKVSVNVVLALLTICGGFAIFKFMRQRSNKGGRKSSYYPSNTPRNGSSTHVRDDYSGMNYTSPIQQTKRHDRDNNTGAWTTTAAAVAGYEAVKHSQQTKKREQSNSNDSSSNGFYGSSHNSSFGGGGTGFAGGSSDFGGGSSDSGGGFDGGSSSF